MKNFKFCLAILSFIYVSMCVYVHMCAGTPKGKMRASDPLELESQVVMS